MKFRVTALLLLFSAHAAAAPLATYANERFGYSIKYPEHLLVPQGEATNRDGQVFEAKSGATLRVWGQYLMGEDLPKQCDVVARAHDEAGAHVTYQVKKKSLTVASGTLKSGAIFYWKAEKAGDVCLTLQLEYPAGERATYDALVGEIAGSLQHP